MAIDEGGCDCDCDCDGGEEFRCDESFASGELLLSLSAAFRRSEGSEGTGGGGLSVIWPFNIVGNVVDVGERGKWYASVSVVLRIG